MLWDRTWRLAFILLSRWVIQRFINLDQFTLPHRSELSMSTTEFRASFGFIDELNSGCFLKFGCVIVNCETSVMPRPTCGAS